MRFIQPAVLFDVCPNIGVSISYFVLDKGYTLPGLPAFQGHFPGGPVLPGVYLAEAAAQAAAVALMAGGRYGGKLPLLAGIRRAVFRRRVLPGETLEIYAAVTEERPELGWAACRGRVSVQGELAAELELCLAFR